jgi:tRNA(fMet)-specific endonuclease VapC
MRYMLDTNVVSDMIRNPLGPVAQRARRAGDAVCVSVIVAAELRYGGAKKGSPQLQQRIEAFLEEIAVLPFDVPADAQYGMIRAELEATGQPIGSNDLLIAAHARALGATMVTANISEFSRVPGLTLENWR